MGGPSVITSVLKSVNLFHLWSEGDVTMKKWSERCYVADFEDRARELETKECGWPLENKIGKDTSSSPRTPERSATLLTP